VEEEVEVVGKGGGDLGCLFELIVVAMVGEE
jgi:hypothetical protein